MICCFFFEDERGKTGCQGVRGAGRCVKGQAMASRARGGPGRGGGGMNKGGVGKGAGGGRRIGCHKEGGVGVLRVDPEYAPEDNDTETWRDLRGWMRWVRKEACQTLCIQYLSHEKGPPPNACAMPRKPRTLERTKPCSSNGRRQRTL